MRRMKNSIRRKIVVLFLAPIAALFLLTVYLVVSLLNYSNSYGEIVSNMTIANSYNLNFKEEMDESIYKLVVGYVTFDNIREEEELKDPNRLLGDLRDDFRQLEQITTDGDSRSWLQNLLRNIDTLEKRIEDIRVNLDEGGHYDENIEMLDNNIYILTELIQDDIQYYIYYQTRSMEHLKNQLNTQVRFLIGAAVGLLAVIFAAAMMTIHLIQRSVVQPIQKLCEVTGRIAGGDFGARAEGHTGDEIAALAGSINDMTEHLEIMVRQIKEDERNMRRAEIRLLQEQINPHFLYNALDAIVWLIESDSREKAMNMVVSLSNFFRLVLSGGKEMISIRDEEAHVRSYLEVQQIRYADILEYEIAVSEELYPYEIMKMTLQPLVENALYHGIKNRRGGGKVTVTGELIEGMIYLAVEDTGAGMSQEELEALRKNLKKPGREREHGFGMANVDERIRMNFGMEYGLSVTSKKGIGTRVEVVIPAQLPETSTPDIRLEENGTAGQTGA